VNHYDPSDTDMNLLAIFQALMFGKNLTWVAGKTVPGCAVHCRQIRERALQLFNGSATIPKSHLS